MDFWDLLLSRYTADPFFVMDNLLQNNRLCDFIDNLVKKYNKDTTESIQWELWLHKVHDKSFSDFLKSLGVTPTEKKEHKDIETIFEETQDVYKLFNNSLKKGV